MIKTIKKIAISGVLALILVSAMPHSATVLATARESFVGSSSESQSVSVAQWRPGSLLATLQWAPRVDAMSYRIYKTGSIRPKWRLFAVMPAAAASRTVADRPGAIAIYRVVAVVNSREVLVGEVIYQPVR
jgi:hypothetical protein